MNHQRGVDNTFTSDKLSTLSTIFTNGNTYLRALWGPWLLSLSDDCHPVAGLKLEIVQNMERAYRCGLTDVTSEKPSARNAALRGRRTHPSKSSSSCDCDEGEFCSAIIEANGSCFPRSTRYLRTSSRIWASTSDQS